MPKSVSTARPSSAKSTLSGLRSRWMTPTAWAAARAAAISRPTRVTPGIGSGPASSTAARLLPSTSSIVKYRSSSASPRS